MKSTQPGARSRGIRGFTLIELMIVVAVVGILAAIAVPSYNDSVRKSRRAQAKADLVEYAQMAERSFTVNNSYTEFALPTNQSPREGDARYLINAATTATTFTITAAPQAGQDADKCGTLTIDQAGVKTPTAAPLDDCW